MSKHMGTLRPGREPASRARSERNTLCVWSDQENSSSIDFAEAEIPSLTPRIGPGPAARRGLTSLPILTELAVAPAALLLKRRRTSIAAVRFREIHAEQSRSIWSGLSRRKESVNL